MTVVLERSYSRHFGLTSLDSDTSSPGATSAAISRTRCSWSGLT